MLMMYLLETALHCRCDEFGAKCSRLIQILSDTHQVLEQDLKLVAGDTVVVVCQLTEQELVLISQIGRAQNSQCHLHWKHL
jgi:hypothetical protein